MLATRGRPHGEDVRGYRLAEFTESGVVVLPFTPVRRRSGLHRGAGRVPRLGVAGLHRDRDVVGASTGGASAGRQLDSDHDRLVPLSGGHADRATSAPASVTTS
jgi:hypothetical protein